MTLKSKTFSAVKWTTFSMLIKAMTSVGQLLVLARILSPTDFGLIAIIVSIVAIAQVFSDMGISNAIIHHKLISNETLSSLFWLNVCSSLVLTLLLIMISKPIAVFYSIPQLESMVFILSFSFVINALGQQIRVKAEKDLHFHRLAIIEVITSILAFSVAVIVAYNGGGAKSIVWSNIVSALLNSLMLWTFLSDGWKPLLRFRFHEVKKFLWFGFYMMGFNIINAITVQLDAIVGGRLMSPSQLGFYSIPKDICYRLIMIINPIVTRVGLPVLASINGDKEKTKSIYLKTILMVSSINFPIFLYILIFSKEIIFLLFGEKWISVVPLLQLFAIWGVVRSTNNPIGSLVMASGRADLQFWWSLGLLAFHLPFITYGAYMGPHSLTVASLILMCGIPIPLWYFLVRPLCGATAKEYFAAIVIPLSLSLLTCLFVYQVERYISGTYIRLFSGFLIGLPVYLLLSFRFNKLWFSTFTQLIFKK